MQPNKDDDQELQAASRTGFELAINHLIEMGKFPDRPSALYGAYRNAHVRHYCNQMAGTVKRLVQKQREQRKAKPAMTNFNPEQSMIIAKGAPINFLDCVTKGLVTGDPYQLTLTAAKAANPGMTEARAFAKFVEANPVLQKYAFAPVDPFSYMQNEPLRKVGGPTAPQALTTPAVTGGEEGSRSRTSTDRDPDPHSIGNVGESAIDQLNALCAAELKRRGLSTAWFARVFSEIYTSPQYAQLAEMERRQNRPGGVMRDTP
jgi:hypothetical protein